MNEYSVTTESAVAGNAWHREKHCNEMAQRGWQLVSVVRIGQYVEFYWRRSVQCEEPGPEDEKK